MQLSSTGQRGRHAQRSEVHTIAGISRFTSMSVASCTSKLRWKAAGSAAVKALGDRNRFIKIDLKQS